MNPKTAPNKAIIAFVLTFVSAFLVSIGDKTSFEDLTPLQWVIVVLSATVTAGGVYMTSNPPTE